MSLGAGPTECRHLLSALKMRYLDTMPLPFAERCVPNWERDAKSVPHPPLSWGLTLLFAKWLRITGGRRRVLLSWLLSICSA